MTSLLPASLQVSSASPETKPTTELLASVDYVLLYFSASWCPPCQKFTPKLIEFYNTHHASHNFAIVFITADRDPESFEKYFGEMPWHAISYDEKETRTALSRKLKVEGIPKLLVFDKSGTLLTPAGVSGVFRDPEASSFPWRQHPFHELLNKDLLYNGEGPAPTVDGKFLGLYFSAHWCPPCKIFTPKLVKYVAELRAKRPDFEFVYVSADEDEKDFQSYFGSMTSFLSLPFGDERINELNERFEIDGIPSLVIIDADGNIITKHGRENVDQDTNAENFPFYRRAVELLGPQNIDALNEGPCLIAFLENEDDGTRQAVIADLKTTAESVIAKAKAEQQEIGLVFFYGVSKRDPALGKLRELLSFTAEDRFAVINIPGAVTYQKAGVKDAEEFVRMYLADEIKADPMV